MPARVIDTAVVKVVSDATDFERDLSRELDQVFAGAERTATTTVSMINRQFDNLERDIVDNFGDVFTKGSIEMNQLNQVSGHVATEIGNDFQRAGEVSERAFAELRRSANADMDRIAVGAAAASRGTEKSLGLGALAGSAAFLGLGAAAVAGLGAIATMGLTSAASLEQVQISFNALLGSAEKGQEVFRDLQKFAAVTPFEFPEVAAAAKRFLAFNEQVGLSDDSLQSFLTTVGDLSSVTGAGAEGLNRITLAIGQMAGKGKVQLEELMQIGEAVPGFSAVGAIAQQLGITTAEAMQKISAGELDATTGIHALLEGMKQFPGAAGAMEKQSQTLLGVFSTFKDTVGQALADSFAPIIPDLKAALTDLTPILGDALRTLAPAIGEVINAALPLLSGFVKAISPVITVILQLLVTALEPLIPVVNQVLETLGAALAPVIAELAPVFADLAKPIGDILLALIPLIPPLGDLAVALVPLVALLVKAVAAFISWAAIEGLVPIVNLLAKGLNLLVIPIAEFAKWLDQINWNQVGDDIADGFSTAFNAVNEFGEGVQKWFRELPGRILDFITSLPERVLQVFENMASFVLRSIGFWIGAVIVLFTRMPGMIVNALVALAPVVGQFFIDAWNFILHRAEERWDQFMEFVKSIPGRVRDGLFVLLHVIPDLLGQAWDNGVAVVSNAVDRIAAFVTGLPARLGGFAADVGSGIVNFIKRALNSAISKVNEGIAAIDNVIPGDLPRIPLLAHGGIAFGPAVIGEDSRTGPEAAIPLGDSRAMAMLRDGLGTGTTFESGAITINVNVNGTVSPSQAQTIGKNIANGLQSVLANQSITTAVKVA